MSTSALELATETVALILRIDDIQVSYRRVQGAQRKLTMIVYEMSIDVCMCGKDSGGTEGLERIYDLDRCLIGII